MAGLLGTQQVAGTPDLQVPHSDFEAGAEFSKVPDGGKALFGHLRQVFVRPVGEVGVGVAGGPAYPAPELMELAQTEPVRVFDDQGIGVGDIQAGFDDGGTDQHIDLSFGHVGHHLAQCLLGHLAVGNADAKARDALLQGACALVDGLGAVVEVEYLAAPVHLPADGIIYDSGIVLHDKGLHRVPVGRGGLDGGHIPDAGQGHVQGPGDGSGGKGQHIHAFGDLFQPLLMGHAEALLFVHHQKPQILELDAFLQQLVGADDHIHTAASHILQCLRLLLGSPEPAEDIHIYREAPEPGDGGLVVLLGKHCGGYQNGHLLAVHNGLHNGPEGNLRFAEAYVAAEKPIHGDGGLHILFDVGDAAQLVVRLRIGEIVFKFPLPGGIGRERVAGLPLSGGVELDELSRHILGGLSGLGLGLLPGVGTDFVQADVGILAAADVFAHQIQLGGGDEKGI